MTVELKNPHSVLAVLATRPEDVVALRLSETRPAGAWAEVADACAATRVPVRRDRSGGRRSRGDGPGRTPPAVAVVKKRSGISLENLLRSVESQSGTWLALDRLQDPHNVGAIFRTAAFFHVAGIVLTRNQSAPLSGTVYDVASGGIEHVPFAVVPNLARALDLAREAGLWVLGTSERADRDLEAVDRERNWLVVVGSEQKGLRRLTLEQCDEVCRIMPRGEVGSLNVSVAAGIVLASLGRGG